MIRIYLPSLADELDRVDPRTSSLTPIRTTWREAAASINLAKARERRAQMRAEDLRVIRGGKP